ncbi:uncharacterized protein LOC144382410 isoform X2 [Halichoerus grypus]
METLALGSPGCRLTLQILGFACLCNSVSWELCSTPFHFGTQAGKAVTILNIAYHCIEPLAIYRYDKHVFCIFIQIVNKHVDLGTRFRVDINLSIILI